MLHTYLYWNSLGICLFLSSRLLQSLKVGILILLVFMDCLRKHCSVYHTVFSSKDSQEKFLLGKWLVFSLGAQCNVCQIVFPPPCMGCQEAQSHTCAIVLSSSFLKSLLRCLVVFLLVSCCCCNDYHKLSGLKQHKVITLQFWSSGILNQFHWTKIQVLAGVSSGDCRGESISLSFTTSWACYPFLRFQSQQHVIFSSL